MQLSAVQCNAMQSRASWWDFVLFFLFCFVLFFVYLRIFVSAVGSYYTVLLALYCNSSNCLGILRCKLLAYRYFSGLMGFGGHC